MAKKSKPAKKRTPPKRTGRRGVGPVDTDETNDAQIADQQELAIGDNGEVTTTTTEGVADPPAEKKKRGRPPKQSRLPEMDDPEIEELESLAEQYAEYRDERMRAGEREVELKEDLLKAMKKHGRERYLHNGIEIRVVAQEETVKVVISKDKD